MFFFFQVQDFSIREVTQLTRTVSSDDCGCLSTNMKGSIFIDEETGECFDIDERHLQVSNNVETGEPEIDVHTRRIRRKVPFQVNLFNFLRIYFSNLFFFQVNYNLFLIQVPNLLYFIYIYLLLLFN